MAKVRTTEHFGLFAYSDIINSHITTSKFTYLFYKEFMKTLFYINEFHAIIFSLIHFRFGFGRLLVGGVLVRTTRLLATPLKPCNHLGPSSSFEPTRWTLYLTWERGAVSDFRLTYDKRFARTSPYVENGRTGFGRCLNFMNSHMPAGTGLRFDARKCNSENVKFLNRRWVSDLFSSGAAFTPFSPDKYLAVYSAWRSPYGAVFSEKGA